MPRLSILIPAYNNLAAVCRALVSLQRYASDAVTTEYLVQDDCSPHVDMTVCISPTLASVERSAANLGFAANCNALAARAHGEILLFLNHDVYAVENWSQDWNSAIAAQFSRMEVGIVGARLLFPDGSIQSAGGHFDARGTPFHRCLGYSDPHYHEVNTPCAVDWTTGAALAVRRDVFLEVGGFSLDYPGGYFEDVDLCMKVAQRRYSIQYEPRCTLVHEVGSTGGNTHFTQNALRFKARWVDSGIVQPSVNVIKEVYW